jgi:GT2 family glycosyltransferase
MRDAEHHAIPLLEALLAQECDRGRTEIVAVDNGSRDGTWACLNKIGRQSDIPLVLVQENGGASSYCARNAGIRAARGQILAFTDADCRPKPDWLAWLMAGFCSPEVGLVAGEIVAAPGENWIGRYCARWGMLSQRYVLTHPHAPYAQTASLAIRRAVFIDVGLFRSGMISGGDADLCWRAARAGWKLQFVRGAVVVHQHRTTLRGLWEQWERYGWGQEHLRELHGAPTMSVRSGAQRLAALFRSEGRRMPIRISTAADLPLVLLCWAAFQAGRAARNRAGGCRVAAARELGGQVLELSAVHGLGQADLCYLTASPAGPEEV